MVILLSCFSTQLDQILIEDLLPVLKDDSLLSSHPIIAEVSSPDEITSVFDGISYSKVRKCCKHFSVLGKGGKEDKSQRFELISGS